MQYFILCAADAPHISGCKISAVEIAQERLQKMRWPIYSSTRNRRAMKQDDRCIVYAGGTSVGAGIFLGEFTIGQIISDRRRVFIDSEDILTDYPDSYIEIIDFKKYPQNVKAKPIIKKMSFFPKNEQKWGVVLIGGCRKIDFKDYSILSASLDALL